ncbi:MAG: biopolymer transporter ExbD [Myxococcota bacterium]
MAGGASEDEDGMISQINVTPLVDITLVLLIVFMVTAKIIVSSALPLDLPKAAQGDTVQLVFSIDMRENGEIYINNDPVTDEAEVAAKAKKALADNPKIRAVIRAGKAVPHGKVIRMLDLLKTAGISKIAFGVTPITQDGPNKPKDAPAPAPAATNG